MQSVFAHLIYTGKALRKDSYLNFDGTKITGVSKSPRGDLAGEFAVITPAFVDAHSHIGMFRAGEPIAEAEANEKMNALPILADALDSLVMDDSSLKGAIETGVLYSCILPGSGNIIGGRSAVIRHYAPHSSAALIARAGIKAAFGYNPMSNPDWKGERPTTRMGAMGMLRAKLDDVRVKIERQKQASGQKKKEIRFSAEQRMLRDLLEGREVLRAHVHKIDDIAALMRIADDFKFKFTVEHAMDVHAPEIFDELKNRDTTVVYGPVDSFAYKTELIHKNWRNIRHLIESGVTFGLMTDHPVVPARNLLIQTRWFLRAGYSKQQAIELITRRNAEILGIDNFLGVLQKGRWASFVGYNGDPFDLACYPEAVYAEGEQLSFKA